MVVQPFDVKKDSFHPCKKGENLLDNEVSYLSATDALIFLANCTIQILFFSINLLVKYNSALTRRHLNDIKHVFVISKEESVLLKWVKITITRICRCGLSFKSTQSQITN